MRDPRINNGSLAFMVSCALGAGGLAGSALAQEGRGAQALDEIVVTARKREESLQDVPISVTAFTGNRLAELQIRNASDIAEFTPGFSFQSYLGRDEDRPVVRGMANILGEANASFFIDGVYVPGSIASTELRNLERVEVIKGPQAALYGRATFAGAINYVTRNPGNEFEGEVTVMGAEHDEFEVAVSHMGPIIQDTLYYYIAGRHFEYGGEYRNDLTGGLVGDQQTRSATGKLFWTPTDSFDATLRLTYAEDRDGHPALYLQGREFNNCFLRRPVAPAARGYRCGEAVFNDGVNLRTDVFENGGGLQRDVLRTSLSLNWEVFDGHTLSSVTGWQSEDFVRELDVSYGGYDPLAYLLAVFVPLTGSFWRVQEEERQSFSQELRLSSPADRSFRWLAGTYYFNDKFDLLVNDKRNPLTNFPAQIDPNNVVQQRNSFTETRIVENMAAFASVEMDFNEQWTGTAELRYAIDRLSNDFVDVRGVPAAYQDAKFYSLSPRVTLSYAYSPDMTVYGNIARGNKPGGFNDPGIDPSLWVYDEEASTNYEVGFKSPLLDGRGRLNVAAFYIDWKDQQLTFTGERADGSLNSFIQNVGKTRVMGLETEFSMLLADNWTLDATYSYVDSEIRDYVSEDQAILLGCANTQPDYAACIQQRGSVAGNQTPRSPKHQASLRSQYSVPLTAGREWFVGGNVTLESSRYSQVHNLIKTGDRWLVGMQTGVRGDRWDVTLWGKNIFNDKTIVDILRYIDTQDWINATPAFPCPPAPGLNRAANCAPLFASGAWGGFQTPRGFANTLPRQRQFGITANLRF